MKNQKLILILAVSLLFSNCYHMNNAVNASQFGKAPLAERKDSVLSIHGHHRIDPYFWMRLTDDQKNAVRPDKQTQKVLEYLNAENAYTEKVMKSSAGLRENLFNEMVGRIKQDDQSVPYFKNGYWYYTRYEIGQEYPIYCRKKENLEHAEEIIINANERAADYNYYHITGVTVSPDNKMLAFAEDTVSRRIYTYRFKNLETGEILPDELEFSTENGEWANDNATFFYTTKDEISLLSNQVWRHHLGTSGKQDVMVYEETDPSYYIGVRKTKSNKYIIIWNESTLSSDYHLINADHPEGELHQFTPRSDVHEYSFVHFRNKFFILTNWDALNFRLMETAEDATSMENWKEVIPHRDSVLIDNIEIFKDYLVLNERYDALTHLRVINQNTLSEYDIDFGETDYVADISINTEFNTSVLRFSYSSLTTPFSIYDYNMDNQTKILKKQEEVVGGHHPSDYQTDRLWANSRDGKKIPISLVYRKGTKLDGTSPLLLYAYGSYGMTRDPYFNSTRLSLLDRGFIYAIAHVRGGQALGRPWYEDGKMFNKKNTFNDFIDCGNFLINQKYTSSEHLYAQGGSAGGLLMGAVANMAPDLFNGIIASVPFVDVVSTMLDETIPLTTNEFDEWGNPKNKAAYDYMLSYSPYDNVEAKDYPNMLVTTGLFDSQVQYWEPAKWVAKLRYLKTDDHLLLFDCNMDAGHGGASGRFERYKETALEYAFMLKLEGITE